MNRYVASLLAAWTLWASLLSQALAAPIKLVDDAGHTLSLKAPPQRVVSLLPSATETLCALGACKRLVGTDRFSNWPASVLALPKLGGLEDAQIERIAALKPELVVAAPHARVVAALRRLKLPVLVLKSDTHADVQRSFELLSAVLGQGDAGLQLWARLQRELEEAALAVPPAWQGARVYFEVDEAPYAAGATSYLGETLQRLKLRNIAPPELGPFPRLNPEFVLRQQPDVVMAAAGHLQQMPRRPGWQQLKALQQRRQCGFSEAHNDILARPGPRMAEGAWLLVNCLKALPAP